MSVAFHHRHDRALVSFAGELSWETGLDLVYTIDLVIDVYFYSVVELVITSPGGNLAALRFVCDALARRRAQGVRFHTRVISRASSAAALLVCLGDERVANAGALLLFHRSRAINVDAISAHETAELLAALSRTDEGWLVALADRALASAPGPARVHDAERADRKVLELLWPEIRPARTKGTPRKCRRTVPLDPGSILACHARALSVYRRMSPIWFARVLRCRRCGARDPRLRARGSAAARSRRSPVS